jgi:uncharacterized membrane protein YhaH (DUF805 family)
MDFGQAIASGFKNYARFSGRAARSEYWYWVLFMGLVRAALRILGMAIFHASGANPVEELFSLLTLIPSLAVAVRRLHDVDRSGWWLLMYLTIIGILYPLLVRKCTKGTDGANRFGPDPLGPGSKAVEVFS